MTLPTGTALHHGNYVIDAFSAEDAIGPIYLATHIPSGRWVQLRILGSRHPEAIPFPEVRKAFYNYLLTIQAFNHPLFSAHLSGFEDGGVSYQVLDADLGHPLSHIVTPANPVPPQQSIALVRQVAQGLLGLKSLGWQGITLTPDQLWQRPCQATLTFTGFNLPRADPLPMEHQEAFLVKGLSYLLYFLLTGKRAEETQAPLAVDVRHQFPGVPSALDAALQLGCHQDLSQHPIQLKQWIDLLPASQTQLENPAGAHRSSATRADSVAPTPARTQGPTQGTGGPSTAAVATVAQGGSTQVMGSQANQPSGPKARKVAPVALVLTALVASFSGLGVGLMARLQPSNPASTGSSVRLNPEQSFPPRSDWSGDDPIDAWNYSPSRRNLPDYGDGPPHPTVVAPDTVPEPSLRATEKDDSLPVNDKDIQDSGLETSSPTSEDGFFIDELAPFTDEPVPESMSSSSESAAPENDVFIQPETTVEPPAPIQPIPEPGTPSAPATPEPLSAPAPLPGLPPSAPAPSTS
jgi:hypothetical protein